ncbi:3-deoxy-manno-octulosonate cytidylyltransferase [Parvularcula sp. ZS-1/3]|uniref:3-deoxy-manno-octulosonate cytidylyltransferase n=1 Tax=Parvularcula mediterranea TaxID=2732508 RepID=A0A7Y3W4S1_9PROT|nr:3-deoxy-manno-octulosonate cytidylyltransferase [Parvularcula mediterranea]NNU15547.1 3-deoxy-manno-octulosonate cytidylyltransferase [Parvularcula mediterranea]
MSRPLIVIPARYGSQRLKGKMLLAETGKPLIQHTWEVCRSVEGVDVVIATDHEDIVEAAKGFGADVVMTDPDHPSGTARVAEAAKGREASMVINCQGDEPEVEPDNIRKLIEGHEAAMREPRAAFISTLACPWPEELDATNPNTVKVVTTAKGGEAEDALYFSRSVMPFPRTREHRPKMHIGLYAFAPDCLQRFAALKPSGLAETESLEQLTALESGERVAVIMVDRASPGIDTVEDYAAFVKRYKAKA